MSVSSGSIYRRFSASALLVRTSTLERIRGLSSERGTRLDRCAPSGWGSLWYSRALLSPCRGRGLSLPPSMSMLLVPSYVFSLFSSAVPSSIYCPTLVLPTNPYGVLLYPSYLLVPLPYGRFPLNGLCSASRAYLGPYLF